MLEFRAVIIYSTGHFQLRVGGDLGGKKWRARELLHSHSSWLVFTTWLQIQISFFPSPPLLLKSKRVAIVFTKKELSNCLPKFFPALQPSSIAICLYLNTSGFPALTTCLKSNYYWVNVTTSTLGNQNKFLLFTSIFLTLRITWYLRKRFRTNLYVKPLKYSQ